MGAAYCVDTNPQINGVCQILPQANTPDPAVVARQAVARLKLPEVNAQVGPDPSVNEWKVVAVGYPIWLWAESPDQLSTSVTEQGITVVIVARRTGASFDMGNGDVVRCTSMTPYRQMTVLPPPESPDCGYRYPGLPAKEGAGFTMTAATHWTVTWSAMGHTGTIAMDRTQSRQMPVAELQSVIVSPKR